DRNRSHWSTSKTPSYTKSVSWQHHPSSYPHHFSSLHISDEMSVKIVLSINLSPVAAVVDLLAITALSG
ncbi:hypothetical protein P2O73_21985, partial [Escherichia coli]